MGVGYLPEHATCVYFCSQHSPIGTLSACVTDCSMQGCKRRAENVHTEAPLPLSNEALFHSWLPSPPSKLGTSLKTRPRQFRLPRWHGSLFRATKELFRIEGGCPTSGMVSAEQFSLSRFHTEDARQDGTVAFFRSLLRLPPALYITFQLTHLDSV